MVPNVREGSKSNESSKPKFMINQLWATTISNWLVTRPYYLTGRSVHHYELKRDLLSDFYYTIEAMEGELVLSILREEDRIVPVDLGGFNLGTPITGPEDIRDFLASVDELIDIQEKTGRSAGRTLQFNEVSPGKYRLATGSRELSFGEVLRYWRHPDFVVTYRDLLLALQLAEFFWEHPRITRAERFEPYEVAIVPSSSLDRLTANPAPFGGKINPNRATNVFLNLSGSALLVVPSPERRDGAELDFSTLRRFLTHAGKPRLTNFFRTLAETWEQQLTDDTPHKFLSTHGLGVSWLHVRLDERPKYYRTREYR